MSPLREDDPMRRSGAHWCEEHDRWECAGHSKRTKARCHGLAISGTDKCRLHAGKPSDLAKAQGEANLAVWTTEASQDLPAVDPAQAVLGRLRLSYLRADLYGQLMRLQFESEGLDGLVGPTYAVGREGVRVETGEQIRGLAKLEADWSDRVVRYSEIAHRMGISERQIELEQEKAQIVTSAFAAALGAVSLLPADKQLMLRTFLTGLGRGPEQLEQVTA